MCMHASNSVSWCVFANKWTISLLHSYYFNRHIIVPWKNKIIIHILYRSRNPPYRIKISCMSLLWGKNVESLQVFHTKLLLIEILWGAKMFVILVCYLKDLIFYYVFWKISAFPCSPKKVIVDISFFRCFDGYNATVFAYGQVGCIYKGWCRILTPHSDPGLVWRI